MEPSLTPHRGSGLEGIDLTQFHDDISKLRGIDGNSVQLIIQRNNNETAYIDHAMPEYSISSNFHANGLIIDLVQHQPHDQSIESHHIYGNSESSMQQNHSPIEITNDRRCYISSNETALDQSIHVSQGQMQHLESRNHFQTIDDVNRRVIIGEANRSYISATEAPVIVCNKDASAIEDIDYSTHFSSAFSQIDQQSLHLHGLKADDTAADAGTLLDVKIQSNTIPPLPPLTPIPKIQPDAARQTPSIGQQNAVAQVSSMPQHIGTPVPKNHSIYNNRNVCLITNDNDEINFIHSNAKYMRQPSREVSIGPKKNLPHKKRITKKLKNISPTMEDQMHIQISDLSYQLPPPSDSNVQQFLSSSSSSSTQQNVSLNLTMNSDRPIQSPNMPVLLHFTCQLCGVQVEEQFAFYTHLKMHYEPVKIGTSVTVTDDVKNENVTTAPPQVVDLDERFIRIQNDEHDFHCMNGIVETEDISDDDSMMINDYSDTGLNSIKAEQNEFSDTEDMLENGVLDKVQRVVDSYIENGGTSDVKNLIEMNEPHQHSQWTTTAAATTTATSIVYDTIVDTGACSSKVIRDANDASSYACLNSVSAQQKNRSKVEGATEAEAAELALMYELNVNDKDFENTTESIIRQHRLATDGSERINLELTTINSSALQPAATKLPNKKTDCIKNEKIKAASNPTPKSVPKLNIQDEFIEEEQQTDSEIDSIDKPDALKKKRKIYRCKRCNKLCNSKNALSYHLLSHTGERPFKCDFFECSKTFFASSALKVHKRLHTGDKPYQCTQCIDTFFRQWGDLKYHIQSKHSKKSEICEFCGVRFARKYSLVLHRRIHTGEKPFKCEFCGMAFRASSYLSVHVKKHTGEKAFACPKEGCLKAFRVRGDLKRHSAIHERNKGIEKDVVKDVMSSNSSTTHKKKKLFALDDNNSIQSRSTTMDTLDQLVSVIEGTEDAFVVNECTDDSPKHRNFPQFELDQGFSKMKFKRDPSNVSPVIVNYNNNSNNK